MKKINKLALGLVLALIGYNTQKETSSTLSEGSRWTGDMDKLIRVMTIYFLLYEKK